MFHVIDKEQSDLLVMHHHLASLNFSRDLIGEQKMERYTTSQSELLVHGWDSEIIVTTFIQFFNTIFGRHTSQLRRLHNLAGSIIILDEVQSIPFEYWQTVRSSILYLCECLKLTIILMTATQPLIFSKGQFIEIAPTDIQKIPQRVRFCLRTRNAVTLIKFRLLNVIILVVF